MSGSKKGTHSAPGQYLGFTLQDVRLAFHLLSAPPGSKVSLEHLDDVAVHYPDGTVLCEQDKSAIDGNPVANSSPDLWKTLANWTGDLAAPTPEVSETYQLYVTPVKKLGSLAAKVHSAKTVAEAGIVIAWAKKKLSEEVGDKLKQQLGRFLATPKAHQEYVICNASILSTDVDPVAPLRALLGPSLKPAIIEICCKHMIGSAQSEARAMILANQPAILDADSFKRSLQDFVERTNMQKLLPNAPKSGGDEIQSTLHSKPTFVRQLELINTKDEVQLRAVADYLQASASKTLWADSALVLKDAFDAWDSVLTFRHGAIRDEHAEVHAGLPPDSRGRLLLAGCKQVSEKLDACEVSHEFVHGSFHDLADRKVVGWHEDFASLLGGSE